MQTAAIRTVLADDHAVVRAGIANALRELENITIVAELGDGGSLVATLLEQRPDLLVTDVTMPNFEPIIGVQRIRAMFPDLKILVVSAYDDDVYVQGLLGAGVDGYHLKDQPLGDLRLAVQRILAGERWICSPLVDKLVRAREQAPAAQTFTLRQRELLRCLHEGLDNQAIARRMGLSVKTVENHLTRLYRQLHVQSRLEAVNYLIQNPVVFGSLGDSPDVMVPRQHSQQALMIVDDNLRYRTQMRKMVTKSFPQVQIFEAENIAAAQRVTSMALPNLALVDVVLGDESGIECARAIKAIAPEIRIVLISAYPDREFHRLGIEAGAIALLDKKDLNAAALREVIEDLLA